ncbi:thioredoxin 2 [compost metagenome]
MTKKIIILAISIFSITLLLINIFHSVNSDEPIYRNISLAEYQRKIKDHEDFSMYIYATSCRACQAFKPIINKVLKNTDKIVFALNIDEDQNRDISFLKEQSISLTPTTINYKNGKMIKKEEGVQTEKEFENFLNNW